MSTESQDSPRQLPENPNLRHLKDQAKDLLKAGDADSLTDAQFKIARLYGFPSWPKLKLHVESLQEAGRLKEAIDRNDLDAVKRMMTKNPALHRAPLGYGGHGPLSWVAECRVPWEAPSPVRLEMATWMIENGSDIHQGGDAPLMRAALNAMRVPMMELLVAHGADVNAQWEGHFPILFAPCESVNPTSLNWLLEHGADANVGNPKWAATALDYVIGAYARTPRLAACIELLLEAGGRTKYDAPAVMDLLRGRLEQLAERLKADPALAHQRFPGLDIGNTGGRRLTVEGATLLHVAAEFCNAEAARLLLDHGADVNAPSTVSEAGVGGQTPIFHAGSQYNDAGLEVAQLLIDRGADLSVRSKLPGDYERPGELVECTPLEYAALFPGDEGKTIALLRDRS